MQSLTKSKFTFILFFSLLTIIGIGIFLSVRYLTDAPSPSSTDSTTSNNNESRPSLSGEYVIHDDIIATVFWAGEGADESNDFIQNRSSFWMDDWVGAYGGVDDPENRCDFKPCNFSPKENPFYFALPYADTNNGVQKPENELRNIPWYDGNFPDSGTVLKNRWIRIEKDGKSAYAQWEDVGPFGENDYEYVFGTKRPSEPRAGLDLSPATADYLSVDGRGNVSWQFIDESDVPAGPWKITVTTSPPKYD